MHVCHMLLQKMRLASASCSISVSPRTGGASAEQGEPAGLPWWHCCSGCTIPQAAPCWWTGRTCAAWMPAGKPLAVKVRHLLCSSAAVGVQLWPACIRGCAGDMQSWDSAPGLFTRRVMLSLRRTALRGSINLAWASWQGSGDMSTLKLPGCADLSSAPACSSNLTQSSSQASAEARLHSHDASLLQHPDLQPDQGRIPVAYSHTRSWLDRVSTGHSHTGR